MKYLILLLLFISCGDGNKFRYLYTEYDAEYDTLIEAQATECINDSRIIKNLKKTNTFEDVYNVGTVYRAQRKIDNESTVNYYFKITEVDGDLGRMKIAVASSSLTNYVINYTESANSDLIQTVGYGVCSSIKGRYEGSSLSASDKLTFDHERLNIIEEDSDDDDDNDPEQYKEIEESYVLDIDYPLVLHQFNGEYITREKGISDDEEIKKEVVFELEELDGGLNDDDCKDDIVCTDGLDDTEIASYSNCNVNINTNHYDSEDVDTLLLTVDLRECLD